VLAVGLLAGDEWRPTRLALAVTAGLYFLYALTYSSMDFVLFFLPGLLLLTPALAAGLRRLGPAALFLPLALVALNYSPQNLRGSPAARDELAPLLLEEETPADAILVTRGPATTALWYFQSVEKMREDLIVVDSDLFQFAWYRQRLGQRYGELDHLAADDLAGFTASNGQRRPVCHLNLDDTRPLRCTEVGA
jgi:hypothetical protein